MSSATELHQLSPSLFIWQLYDPAVKTDLFSSAIVTDHGTYIIDPVPLDGPELARLADRAPIAGIVITNSNHQRAALDYSGRFSAPIFAGRGTFSEPKPARLLELDNAAKIGGDFDVIAIEGCAVGEIAVYHAPDSGTLMVGDALIHLEPYGFTVLPRKYCLNQKEMRRSLRRLLAFPAERMLFAHGTPLLSGAGARLQRLLNGDL